MDVVGSGQLMSAGNYLYAPSPGDLGVERFTKATGDWGRAVGATAGDKDGTWNFASFGDVRGITTNGEDLWVTDSGYGQLREVSFSDTMGLQMGGG